MRTQLKKLTMYNKVKELLLEGLSIRQISRNMDVWLSSFNQSELATIKWIP